MRYVSPLRYPGGKAKLATFIQAVLTKNRLHDATYVEPYAGGASVALSLLLSEHVAHVHINDIDPGVHAFWRAVLFETDALCDLVGKTPTTIREWRKQRAIHARGTKSGMLPLGFATLYLNRTNRSGIINSGGPIGGLKQDGEWKLDARFPREGLVERIKTIAAYRDRITLHNEDASILLKTLTPGLPERSLLYLDPPYYVKGYRRLYFNGYEHADHVKIAKLVKPRARWVVSYDDVPAIRKIYRKHSYVRYNLAYSASERQAGAEIAFFSADLDVPRARRLLPDLGVA